MLAKILDFTPALAFFITYRLSSDLILATGVIIGCCLVSFILQYVLYHKTSRLQLFLTAAVLLFGVPTILLNDPLIIKWKVTVVNLIFAATIFVFQHVIHRNPFSYLFGKEVPLPEHIWLKLGTSFMCYFVFAAGLNVIIAFYLPTLFGIDPKSAESLWVDYKTFGNAILNFIFSVAVILILMRRYPEVLTAFTKDDEENKAAETVAQSSAVAQSNALASSNAAVESKADLDSKAK